MNPEKKPKSSLKTNVIYGLLVLVPAAVIFIILADIIEILKKIADAFNLQSAAGFFAAVILALLLLLILCFIVGALVRTRIGSLSLEKFERLVLKQIPGYEIISNVMKGFAEKKAAYPSAMIQLYGEGTSVLGFIMEENDDGTLTVFVPTAPMLTVGSLHLVDRERVTVLKAGAIEVTTCISQWGIGLKKLLD